jgi:hypothetical protein
MLACFCGGSDDMRFTSTIKVAVDDGVADATTCAHHRDKNAL